MLHLIEPIWLFALAGIAVPVIIHLWNIKKGRTIKVGSISLLTGYSKKPSRSLRVTDLLLLLLRCLFITLLALLLSKPQWRNRSRPAELKGWVMAEPGSLGAIYPVQKPLIDSLLKKGLEFHYFSTGFGEQSLAEALKNGTTTLPGDTLSYWSLLKELDHQVPQDFPVHLFTSNSLARFTGNRPRLSMNLQWHTFAPPDSVGSWLAAAYVSSGDSIHIIEAVSHPESTSFRGHSIAYVDNRDTRYSAQIQNGKLLVSGRIQDAAAKDDIIEVDTSTMRLTIFTDKFENDALYLKAAIQAIQQFTGRRILISTVSGNVPAGQDWLFWLSETTLPASIKVNNLFKYEGGEVRQRHTHFRNRKASLTADPILLYKTIAGDSTAGTSNVLWKDGFDNAVLSKKDLGNGHVYHFYSRFDPGWNDLVWSDEFPRMIGELLMENKRIINKDHLHADKRIIDTMQMQAATSAGGSYKPGNLNKNQDLSRIIWLSALVVFLLERVLSFTQKKQAV